MAENNVTITAPPSVLEQLKASPPLSGYRSIALPLLVPYHSSHLFSQADVTSILESGDVDYCYSRQSFLPLLSGHNGNVIWGGTFRSLLEASLQDILLHPIRWDLVSRRVAKASLSASLSPPVVHPLSTNLCLSLTKAIKSAAGSDCPKTHDHGSRPENTSGEMNPSAPNLTAASKIAIVGRSGRFPGGGENDELFWKLLRAGIDTHQVVPARSWNHETHCDPELKRKNTAATPYGCWLDHPEMFDNKFFYISPREAPQVDPAQRLALMTAYEAIEQAGIVPDGSPSTQKDRVGVFYGCQFSLRFALFRD